MPDAGRPVNKPESDKIRNADSPPFFLFRRRKQLFWHSGPRLSPLDAVMAVGSRSKNPLATKLRVCLVLPHIQDARKNARWSKTGGLCGLWRHRGYKIRPVNIKAKDLSVQPHT
jgi:hypothetical protein